MPFEKLISDMKEARETLYKFPMVAKELGIELTPVQEGVIKGHTTRLNLEIKRFEQEIGYKVSGSYDP